MLVQVQPCGQKAKTVVNPRIIVNYNLTSLDFNKTEGLGHNECEGIVAIFTNRVGVMGLGSISISELKIIKIIKSHKDIDVGCELENGYYTVREFEI